MTDPSDSLSLADNGADQRDLPPPAPLRITPETALFLDFDGTLVEIADHPDDVVVPADLAQIITTLSQRLKGRLAIVSGRSIAALEAMLGPLDVAVAGSHGGEFRPSGAREVEPLAQPLPASVMQRLAAFAKENGDMLVEPKPFSIAVHYRRHPEALEGLLACASDIAQSEDLHLKHGKQVIELAMPGSDKGSAVAAFLKRPEFTGTSPLFLGDDVTDEDAFKAITSLGGAGVLVGPLRPSAAHYRLSGVQAVHDWLAGGLAPAAPHETQREGD